MRRRVLAENMSGGDYSKEYFTIVAKSGISFLFRGSTSTNQLQYSTDNGSTWSTGSVYISVTSGDKVMFKGTCIPTTSSPYGIGQFKITGNFDVEGNAMSLLYGDGFKGETSLSGKSCAFSHLFKGCTSLVSAENLSLPATTLVYKCYESMFEDCTSLTTAPTLPATTLAQNCYSNMFKGCTGLATSPSLPATTLADACYHAMFKGTNVLPDCTNIDFRSPTVIGSGGLNGLFYGTKLTDAQLDTILKSHGITNYSLPSTTLAGYCYASMFRDCTSLTTAPSLPATTLAQNCYSNMFDGCTSLTTAPASLPATTLEYSCYSHMFENCTSLTTAPELSATKSADFCCSSMFSGCTSLTTAPTSLPATLAQYCFSNMFYNCSSLTSAPTLPATTLRSHCYSDMFENCTSLTTAPSLPATTLANDCYSNMFYKCSSLTSAPRLPAKTLVSSCYHQMFSGCSNLSSITCLATDISASSCTSYWLLSVNSFGTFTTPSSTNWKTDSPNGIPEGWIRINS